MRILLAPHGTRGDVQPMLALAIALRARGHAALFPRVAAVVHNGGAGTTTAAARAGAPQFVLPHILDQYYWARASRSWASARARRRSPASPGRR